jgi:hypothetical protein
LSDHAHASATSTAVSADNDAWYASMPANAAAAIACTQSRVVTETLFTSSRSDTANNTSHGIAHNAGDNVAGTAIESATGMKPVHSARPPTRGTGTP